MKNSYQNDKESKFKDLPDDPDKVVKLIGKNNKEGLIYESATSLTKENESLYGLGKFLP